MEFSILQNHSNPPVDFEAFGMVEVLLIKIRQHLSCLPRYWGQLILLLDKQVQNVFKYSLPVLASLDLRLKDQPSGVMEAQCGSRSSTGFRNFRPWGLQMTTGLRRVSP